MSERLRVGVIGVGTIAAVLVDAVLTGPRGDEVEVVLSPRSESRASALAARHPAARVAADNQAVLDATDVVLLAVLPPQMAEVCAGLSFRDDHVVASLAAGYPPSVLAAHVAPASTLCQLIPLPMAALRTGPIVMFPDVPVVHELLEGCGDIVLLEHESDVIVLSCLSASMSAFFELQTTLVDWAVSKGMTRATAVEYVTSQYAGLAAEAVAAHVDDLHSLALEHETPGGLNEQVRRALTEAGAYAELTRQLDSMHATRMARPPQ